jgi:lipoprotein-anchoring transpeptidase ErfK/SrfK
MNKTCIVASILALSILVTGCGTHSTEKTSSTTTASRSEQTNTTTKITNTHYTKANSYPAETLSIGKAVGPNFDWTKPSDGPYPTITKQDHISIDCSISEQRVRILNDNKVIYTMITSSGMDGADSQTPTGTYYIQPERGTWFYNQNEKEGAEYWVSWKDHGIFLFHSVAMDENKHVIPSEAAKLGTKASHGCFRLTISDAKWIYDNIPTGTKVVVHA